MTVTRNEIDEWLPEASLAVQVTVVVPTGKWNPVGWQSLVGAGSTTSTNVGLP